MDSIFQEDADEIGGEIEAYCPAPRCKTDTTHTITSMYEDEVRRVQCMVCGEVHAYRKPRGDGEGGEDGPKKPGPRLVSWEDAMARVTEADLANARPYSIRDSYEEGDVVLHPTFDVGIVVDQLPDNCVAMVFRGSPEPKKFIHNRGIEFAARMPEIAEIPAPRDGKKKKRAKKVDSTSAPVAARTKAELDSAIQRARTAAQTRIEEASRTVDERTKKLSAQAKGRGKTSKPSAATATKAQKSVKDSRPAQKAPVKKAPAKKAPAKKASEKKLLAKKKLPAKKPPAKKPPAKKPPAKKPSKPAKKRKK